MVTATTPRVVATPHSDEWYAARSTGIGASEAAAACGMSQWQTPLELYHRKRGELPPIDDNDAMRLGRKLEPIIKDEFCLATDAILEDIEPPMFRHPDLDFMLATPDGIVISPSELLECKSSSSFVIKADCGDEGTDEVPTSWLMQAQQQIAVCGADLVHVAALLDGRTLKLYRIERNSDLIELIAAAESDLWDRIQAGTPPEPDWTHRTTLGLIRALHGAPEDETDIIALESAIVAEWEAYESLGKQIKELDDLRNVARAKVMHAVGEHAGGFLGDGRMVRRKLTERKGYTVEPTSFVDFRAVKVPKGLEVRL